MEQVLVDVDLPRGWIDDDGTEHPSRVQAGVTVLGESRRARGKTSSAARELVDWMRGQGLEGREEARLLLEVLTLEGCSVQERTLRWYVKGASDAAKTAKALGFRHEPADKSGRGQAPLRCGSPPPTSRSRASSSRRRARRADHGGAERGRRAGGRRRLYQRSQLASDLARWAEER